MKNLINKYQELSAEKKILEKQLKEKQVILKELKSEKQLLIECREIVNDIANRTVSDLIAWIEQTVSYAIEQIYPGYSFRFSQEIKRNQLELLPKIIHDDKEYPPEYSVGGGMLDIISIAMRIAIWAVQKEKTMPFFILDEPMKFMGKFSEQGAQIIQQLSDKLGLQFLIITHDENLIDGFDNPEIFRFYQEKGVTCI